MVKRFIYLFILIVLSLSVIENVRMAILDNVLYPILNTVYEGTSKQDIKISCGQIKLYVRDYDTAEKIFIDVIRQTLKTPAKNQRVKAFYELGNVYYQTQEYEKAAKAYERVLQENSGHRKALRKYARINMAMKDYVPVYNYANAYVRVKPKDAFGHSELCAVLTRLGEFSKARVSCEKAIELRRGYARAHYDFAVLLNVQGFKDMAKKEYKEAISHSRHIKSRIELEKALNLKPKVQEQ